MGRAVLLVGAVVWGIAALSAFGVSLVGIDRLVDILPELAIDEQALAAAIVAMGAALGLVAVIHVGVLLGLRRRMRAATSAATLLAAVALAVFVALAAAAFASAAAEPPLAIALTIAGLASVVVAAAYGAAVIGFVREIGAGGPS